MKKRDNIHEKKQMYIGIKKTVYKPMVGFYNETTTKLLQYNDWEEASEAGGTETTNG